MSTVTFAVNGSNSFHKLELSRSLLRFAEFDFTYFWEQCIEAGRNARKTGRISPNMQNLAVNALVKCHPYVEACINTEFSAVVLDCIIAYICHCEGIGLEELWARCISPKSLYEKDIFNRVSEYKTGRGINQWINIVRMQEYARSKMKFIYETDGNVMLLRDEYRARREYFDLAFAVAANETGCPMKEMPSVKKYSPSSLPDSVFMIGRVSKNIYRRLSEVLGEAELCEAKKLSDHNRDQTALDAFSYVKDMPRPAAIDMNFAMEAINALPETIYVPDSFKAMIDLEFTCMYEEGIYLAKCPRCGRYFVRELTEKSPYCHRVNSSGRTCSELIESELGIAASKYSDDDNSTAVREEPSEITENTAPDTEEAAEPITEAADEAAESAAPITESDEKAPNAEYDEKPEPIEIPKELERRCQRVYNLLYKRIGKIMTETEFKEWSRYLSDTKRDLREGNAEISQMENFLDYWETAVKQQSKRAKRRNIELAMPEPVHMPLAAELESNAPQEENEQMNFFAEAMKESEAHEQELSGISPAGTEATPEERSFKPFTPPKYNTVLEAMLDGKYKSDELLSENGGSSKEDISEIKVNGKKIRLPEWERITR